MNPANHWNAQPKRGYENHFIHDYDSQADRFRGGHNGYRAQFCGEHHNEGYNGAWNERHGYGGHGAYNRHNGMPHDAMRYDGFGGQHQHQHQHRAATQHHSLWNVTRLDLVALSPRGLAVEAKSRTRTEDRTARHLRIRKKVEGTPERPRLCVFRSNKHIYVQVIDDSKMHTLASASTVQKPVSEEFDLSSGPTIDVAKRVGEVIAKSCLEKGITKVAFDRGGYPYHGRIEALADAAREHGLQF